MATPLNKLLKWLDARAMISNMAHAACLAMLALAVIFSTSKLVDVLVGLLLILGAIMIAARRG